MSNYYIFIFSTVAFLIDIPYLLINREKYNNMIETIQKSKLVFRKIYLIPIYLLIGITINLFYKNSKLNEKLKLRNIFIIGVCIYGIYNLNNYAIISKWDPLSMIIDTVWGGVLFLLTTYISVKIINKVK